VPLIATIDHLARVTTYFGWCCTFPHFLLLPGMARCFLIHRQAICCHHPFYTLAKGKSTQYEVELQQCTIYMVKSKVVHM